MRAVGIPSELIVNVCRPAGVVDDWDMADRDVPAARTVAQREGGEEEGGREREERDRRGKRRVEE